MSEVIASAIIELARYAVIAFAIHRGSIVLLHWLDKLPTRPTRNEIVDLARREGLTLEEGQRTV